MAEMANEETLTLLQIAPKQLIYLSIYIYRYNQHILEHMQHCSFWYWNFSVILLQSACFVLQLNFAFAKVICRFAGRTKIAGVAWGEFMARQTTGGGSIVNEDDPRCCKPEHR